MSKKFALIKDNKVVNIIRNYREEFDYGVDEVINNEDFNIGDEIIEGRKIEPEVVIPEPKPYEPSDTEILLEALKDKVTTADLKKAKKALKDRRKDNG